MSNQTNITGAIQIVRQKKAESEKAEITFPAETTDPAELLHRYTQIIFNAGKTAAHNEILQALGGSGE